MNPTTSQCRVFSVRPNTYQRLIFTSKPSDNLQSLCRMKSESPHDSYLCVGKSTVLFTWNEWEKWFFFKEKKKKPTGGILWIVYVSNMKQRGGQREAMFCFHHMFVASHATTYAPSKRHLPEINTDPIQTLCEYQQWMDVRLALIFSVSDWRNRFSIDAGQWIELLSVVVGWKINDELSEDLNGALMIAVVRGRRIKLLQITRSLHEQALKVIKRETMSEATCSRNMMSLNLIIQWHALTVVSFTASVRTQPDAVEKRSAAPDRMGEKSFSLSSDRSLRWTGEKLSWAKHQPISHFFQNHKRLEPDVCRSQRHVNR